MAKTTKTSGAKGSPVVAAPKPEATKGKTPVVNVKTPDAPAPDKAKVTSVAGKYLSRDQFNIGDGKGERRVRVAEYQDYTFSINDRPARQFTDEELCEDWQTQFPTAVRFLPFHVRGARRDFNSGRHSKAFNTPRSGDSLSIAYVTHEGTRMREDRVPKPAPKPKAAKTAATEPPAEPKAAEPVKTPAKKAVVVRRHHAA